MSNTNVTQKPVLKHWHISKNHFHLKNIFIVNILSKLTKALIQKCLFEYPSLVVTLDHIKILFF